MCEAYQQRRYQVARKSCFDRLGNKPVSVKKISNDSLCKVVCGVTDHSNNAVHNNPANLKSGSALNAPAWMQKKVANESILGKPGQREVHPHMQAQRSADAFE